MNPGVYAELSRTLHQPNHRIALEVTLEITRRCPSGMPALLQQLADGRFRSAQPGIQ